MRRMASVRGRFLLQRGLVGLHSNRRPELHVDLPAPGELARRRGRWSRRCGCRSGDRQPAGCWPGGCQRRGRTTPPSPQGRARGPGQEGCGSSGTGEGPSGTLHCEALGQSSGVAEAADPLDRVDHLRASDPVQRQPAGRTEEPAAGRSSRRIVAPFFGAVQGYRIASAARLTFHVEVFRLRKMLRGFPSNPTVAAI